MKLIAHTQDNIAYGYFVVCRVGDTFRFLWDSNYYLVSGDSFLISGLIEEESGIEWQLIKPTTFRNLIQIVCRCEGDTVNECYQKFMYLGIATKNDGSRIKHIHFRAILM